ncbi:hypothetical protein [Arthrobacter bambusae]|uniref:hypothetical protein n=1 Tax=Arthrobacter bambusae TaxID=1338426 RepID=UPI0027824494|nr:hypothetical protein [Arthrobacter bambusae]MDQ0028458.1 hypothetical protein [Arthrobacter bambusae]MDQ0096747.1 hypothetical protein [Arthrobacter bambusae]
MKRFVLALLAAVLLLCACSGLGGPDARRAGVVTGVVLTAPVCPVERVGQECPPRSVAGAGCRLGR